MFRKSGKMLLPARNAVVLLWSASRCVFAAVIASGRDHSCALLKSGSVKCWGNNTFGQSTPPQGEFITLSAGDKHTCGVRKSGNGECWGDDSYQQLGKDILSHGDFKTFALGGIHTCGIIAKPEEAENMLGCWGYGKDGRSQPPHDGEYIEVTAAGGHACALTASRKVKCWGMNDQRQSTPPTLKFKQLAAGAGHTCGLQMSGKVVCWGDSEGAQNVPADTFKDISAYGFFSCGLLAASEDIKCWPQSKPPPSGPYGALAAGGMHVCAVHKSSHKMECWGGGSARVAPEGEFQIEADSKLKVTANKGKGREKKEL